MLVTPSYTCSITSLFFGGGTPSLAHPSTVSAILETVSRHASISAEAEVTLEVNPTPAGMSKLEEFCRAGVNRFSIGVQVDRTRTTTDRRFLTVVASQHITQENVQSLQDDDLKTLGRDHSGHQALQTVERARSLCPGRVSVDVMFARPKQSVESWETELRELLKVCDDHVSLYQLTLERGTRLFRQVQGGEVTVPADEVTAEMYQRARRTLQQHGFHQYEVSNFARLVSAERTFDSMTNVSSSRSPVCFQPV